MRLWTLHPQLLDPAGLTAVWREALLAREVLRGRTRGYRQHPQLVRFRACAFPRSAINAYLEAIHAEAFVRGYRFDRSKLGRVQRPIRLDVTQGQLSHEWQWLLAKLARRNPVLHAAHCGIEQPLPHPLFRVVSGPVAEWERGGIQDSGVSSHRG